MKLRTLLLNSILLALAISAHGPVLAAGDTSDPDLILALEEVDTRPEVVKVRQPEYPAALAGSGQSGMVAVTVVVDQMGDIESIEVAKASAPAFGEAALECVRQWKFLPATVKGRSVKVRMSLPVRFPADVTAVARN